MTALLSPPTGMTEAAAPASESWRRRMMVWGAAALCGHAVLLYWHAAQLLSKPHFQFVVLLPLAVGVLAWRAWREVPERSAAGPVPTAAASAGALLLLGLAIRWWSPWLGALSAMVSLLVWIYLWGGGHWVRAMFPAWLLTGFAVGPPFEADTELIQMLRGRATRWTSWILDYVGVLHLPQGSTIRVPDQTYFVADACTGIHSLFVILAFALFLGFWNRRNVVQIASLLACAAGLVMMENITRLVLVVVLGEGGLDVASGWPHTVLGMAVFAGALGLVWSADQFLAVVIPDRWPRFLRRRRFDGMDEVEGGSDSGESGVHDEPSRFAPGGPPWGLVAAASAAFLLAGGWQLHAMPRGAPRLADVVSAAPFRELRGLSESTMPPRIGQWLRKGYRFVERDVENPQGQFSHLWEYEWRDRRVEFSVDYPFPAIHDACLCFEELGWTIETQTLRPDPGNEVGYVRATISKPLAGEGLLLSSFLNRAGEFGVRVYPRERAPLHVRLMRRLNSLIGGKAGKPQPGARVIPGPVVQIRLAAKYHRGFSNEEVEAFEKFYRAARVILREPLVRRWNSKKLSQHSGPQATRPRFGSDAASHDTASKSSHDAPLSDKAKQP